MSSINQIQDTLIEDFDLYEDWMDKYEALIELGGDLKPLSDDYKTEEFIVKGCQSQVWLRHYMKEDKMIFEADSDAQIPRGIVALLVQILSNHTPKEIAEADLYSLDKIGLTQHLSPNRANGLSSMLKRMKTEALAAL